MKTTNKEQMRNSHMERWTKQQWEKTNTHLAGQSIIQTGSYPEGTIHNTETKSQDGRYIREPSAVSQPVRNVWLIDNIL